jgi:hypothetical protein
MKSSSSPLVDGDDARSPFLGDPLGEPKVLLRDALVHVDHQHGHVRPADGAQGAVDRKGLGTTYMCDLGGRIMKLMR